MTACHVLILDDDPEMREFISLVVNGQSMTCTAVESFPDLELQISRSVPDVIFLDLSLDETDGVEVLRHLGRNGYKGSIFLISSFEERLLKSAMNLGTSYGLSMLGILQKPLKAPDIRAVLETLPDSQGVVREEDLESAIKSGHLSLNYQPKIDLQSRKVLSAEALVRWNDPKKGTIYPDQFIPLAEKSGLINPMTDLVINMALQEAKKWETRGWDIAVAVNLSPRTLTDLDIPNRIGRQLNELNLAPNRLILEVTESTAMTDVETTLDILTRLRIKGIRVSLDDFGTGYSSLVELHRMPFSEVKIDRSFVMEADRDNDSRIIVEAILGLAQAMKLKVVAEGVETQAHWDMLRETGCDMAQGYHISRPLPPEEFNSWIDNWNQTFEFSDSKKAG